MSTSDRLPPAPWMQSPSDTGRTAQDAIARAMRAPGGKVALTLHLSRLRPPAPRAYHTRIAMALMQDAAQILGGQVLTLHNADLLLLGGAEAASPAKAESAADALAAALQRLFGADAPGIALTTQWRLEQEQAEFADYVSRSHNASTIGTTPAMNILAPDTQEAGGLPPLAVALLEAGAPATLVQRTTVQLRTGKGLPLAARLAPLFREFAFDHAPTDGRSASATPPDPSLLRHLAAGQQSRLLHKLRHDLLTEGSLTRPALLLDMRILVTLMPSAVTSPGFALLVEAARARGANLGVCMAAPDIAAAPPLADFARRLLRQEGVAFVVDGIDHAALAFIRPGALSSDWVRLAWSPRMVDGPPALLADMDAAIQAITPARIVLRGVDGEAALHWGQARAITAYEGSFPDAVQAAARIAICPAARACSLRQCAGRSRSLHPAGRGGCGAPGLLDIAPFITRLAGAA